MSREPLRIALLGAGTVGREVARALLERGPELTVADGRPLQLAGIAVRNVDRARAAGLPADLLTDAPAHLVADPKTDVIVELMGGDEPARTMIAASLAAGKDVVTANKHVLAHHGSVLEGIARRTGAALRFEAAVGGGIPILGPLAQDLAANRIRCVRGIVNGTTNYILTAMADEGRDYGDALAAAQAAGYAEADPSGDVEGHDAVNKLVILARLAFGTWLAPDTVLTTAVDGPGAGSPGITGIVAADLAAASAAGATIKLIAQAIREEERGAGADHGGDDAGGDNGGDGARGRDGARERDGVRERDGHSAITASVLPTVVPADSPFGRTGGALNRIEIEADPVGTIAFSGPGAGGPATSSAVLGDLIAVARKLGSTWAGLPLATAAR